MGAASSALVSMRTPSCPASEAAQPCRKVRLPGMRWYSSSLSIFGQPIQTTSAPVSSLRAHTASAKGPSVSPSSFAVVEFSFRFCLL